MPAALVISSVTANAYTTPDGATPTAGVYYPVPGAGMGSPPWVSDPAYIEVKHEIPNIGIGTTRLSTFGSRTVHADLIFVDTTTGAATARYFTALGVFQVLVRFNITLRGTTIQGCKLVRNSAHFIGQEWRGNRSHVAYGFTFEELG